MDLFALDYRNYAHVRLSCINFDIICSLVKSNLQQNVITFISPSSWSILSSSLVTLFVINVITLSLKCLPFIVTWPRTPCLSFRRAHLPHSLSWAICTSPTMHCRRFMPVFSICRHPWCSCMSTFMAIQFSLIFIRDLSNGKYTTLNTTVFSGMSLLDSL